MRSRQLRAWVALGVLSLVATCAWADALDDIRRRGTLIVGVKIDVPLWGRANEVTGVPEGLEPDLAADLAVRLGVRLKLVGVLTAERIDAVQSKRVDVLIATLSDTPERRQRMTLVSPHYYASGANILARKDAKFRDWSQLRNRRVCGRLGAFYNRLLTVAYGLDIVALYSNRLAMAALRDGRCAALLYDDTNIVAMMQEPAWAASFEMPLKSLYVTPWSVALHASERGGRLEAAVSDAITKWHSDGLIMQLERKWNIPVSGFTLRMNKELSAPAPPASAPAPLRPPATTG
ncbi:MAG TPA: transporter substrate-binding domain-containing protein [Ramlibacter sp.]|nr:transporter substrate-binding domain-containing protein [Ramlibacter sp.]